MKITRGTAVGVGVASMLLVLGGCVTTKSKRLADPHAQADAAADNIQLAMAYMQEGNLARAKEKLDRAIKEDPTNPNVHSVYALFYERINDQKNAENEFHEALRLAPNDPGQVNFYGVYLCRQHRVDEGVTKMLQVATNPLYRTPEAAYTNIGVCLLTAHRDEEAESAFRRALAARPDFAEAAYQLADLELAHGRALEARERVEKFLAQFTPTPELLLVALRASRTLGDAHGVAQYTKILRVDFPNSEQTRSLSTDAQSNPG
ncbi:MAG TPA: type IV pilus biogenesis/stability protein PilW [Steroidobacteraceae bacterium]|jgi:type IV pilus assembly protein PilF|nr:type IV pilus biogenesis/stability protein PilW [Steroidobacteraceae bacterium]